MSDGRASKCNKGNSKDKEEGGQEEGGIGDASGRITAIFHTMTKPTLQASTNLVLFVKLTRLSSFIDSVGK